MAELITSIGGDPADFDWVVEPEGPVYDDSGAVTGWWIDGLWVDVVHGNGGER